MGLAQPVKEAIPQLHCHTIHEGVNTVANDASNNRRVSNCDQRNAVSLNVTNGTIRESSLHVTPGNSSEVVLWLGPNRLRNMIYANDISNFFNGTHPSTRSTSFATG